MMHAAAEPSRLSEASESSRLSQVPEPSRLSEASRPDRAFDYGEADELESTLRQLRLEIAATIRRAATADPDATFAAQQAYERAARLAEGDPDASADAQTPRWSPGA